MKMMGQRWQFRIDNHVVNVDNAFSWWGWGQERLLINQESVKATGQWFVFRRSFAEPWLTRIGEDELTVKMRSTIGGIDCRVRLAGEELEPDTLYQLTWRGDRNSWPVSHEWEETDAFFWDKLDPDDWLKM